MAREFTPVQRMERQLLTEQRPRIWRPFMRAVREYKLLSPGDRIAVCISGGKDSMLLAVLMRMLGRQAGTPFEPVFLIMDPGYRTEVRRQVEENARQLEIPYTLFESDVFEVAEAQGERSCFLCARMRRGCLYGKARELGCNKIALGHHYDDVIETTLMAMLHGGQIQAMLPRLRAKNFPGMELIRPMYGIREADIAAWGNANGLRFISCACRLAEAGSGEASSRRESVKQLIARLHTEDPKVEQNIFNSIRRVQLDTLPGWKYRGEQHTFLEGFDDSRG